MGNATRRSPVKKFRNNALQSVRNRLTQINRNERELVHRLSALNRRMNAGNVNERNIINMNRGVARLEGLRAERNRLTRMLRGN